jgi:acetyltransferase-like isoleucine patch superfamily enzyme
MAQLPHDWFEADLPSNVVIGPGSWLYSSYAFLHYRSSQPVGVRVGCESGIYDGTFFDLGPNGSIRIGDYTTIVGAIICSDGEVEIGDYCLIAHEVVLADVSCGIPGAPSAAMDGVKEKRGITIGRNCWIATGAILLGGARVGENSIVAAHTVVDFEIPSGKMVVGNPPRILDLPQARPSEASLQGSTEEGS